MRETIRLALLLGAVLLCPGGASLAQESAGASAREETGEVLVPVQQGGVPRIGLDDLLRLPDDFAADVDRRGGATRQEWSARFSAARDELEAAKEKLVEFEREMERSSDSSSAWQVSAPGSSDPQTSPLNLRLRQELKDQRIRIEEAARRQRALDVEADLASVPLDWRS
jgi:hypothetical protein